MRVTPELHLGAVLAARRAGVSLNAWVAGAIADRLGKVGDRTEKNGQQGEHVSKEEPLEASHPTQL